MTTRNRPGGLFDKSSTHSVAWHEFRPEVRLVCAVIQQACKDAMEGSISARAFIKSADFAHWCELIDLNPGYVREMLHEEYRKTWGIYKA